MFNRSWGAQIEVPYWRRTFTTDLNFPTPPVATVSRTWNGLGDIRVQGLYTGFSEDLSSGVTFGLKLPTGSFTHDSDVVDRDTQIGSGSTDLLLGGFHRQSFGVNSPFKWFAQAEVDVPLLAQDHYRPGVEFHLHLVSFYADVEVPVFEHVTGNQLVAPVLVKVALSYHF